MFSWCYLGMAVDISIENFAFALFRKIWEEHGIPKAITGKDAYSDEPHSETECSDEVFKAVYLKQAVYHSFCERVLEGEYAEFSTSRSDFHSYFTDRCCCLEFEYFNVMDKILASAALLAEMGLYCARKDNLVFVKTCPLSFAMYFDWELKSEFYKCGGWTVLQSYCGTFERAYSLVKNMGHQRNLLETLMHHFSIDKAESMTMFLRMGVPILAFSVDYIVFLLKLGTIATASRFNTLQFKGILCIPMYLKLLCNPLDDNNISYLKKFETPTSGDICLVFDALEKFIMSESCNLYPASKPPVSNQRQPVESSPETSELADDESFPISQLKLLTVENSKCNFTNSIPNSTISNERSVSDDIDGFLRRIRHEPRVNHSVGYSGASEISEHFPIPKPSVGPESKSCSLVSDCVSKAFRLDGVDHETKDQSQIASLQSDVPLPHKDIHKYKRSTITDSAEIDEYETVISQNNIQIPKPSVGPERESRSLVSDCISKASRLDGVDHETKDQSHITSSQSNVPLHREDDHKYEQFSMKDFDEVLEHETCVTSVSSDSQPKRKVKKRKPKRTSQSNRVLTEQSDFPRDLTWALENMRFKCDNQTLSSKGFQNCRSIDEKCVQTNPEQICETDGSNSLTDNVRLKLTFLTSLSTDKLKFLDKGKK